MSIDTKKPKKNNLRYFGRVTKDLYTTMPAEITVILLLKVVYAFIALYQVTITAELFDAMGGYHSGFVSKQDLLGISYVFIGVYALPLFLSLIEYYINDLRIFVKQHRFIQRLHSQIVSLPLINFERPEFHNEIARATACIKNNGLLNYFYGFTDFAPIIFRFVGIVIVLSRFHILFLPLAVISIVPTLITKWIYNNELYRYKRKQTPLSRRRDYLWNVLTGKDTIKELRTMDIEDYFIDKWTQERDECLDQDFNFDMKSTNVFLFCDIFKLLAFAASIALSIHFMKKDIITIGQFSACIAAFSSLQFYVEKLVGMITEQNKQANFAGDYYDFFDHEIETSGKIPCKPLHTKLEAREISFKYPNSPDRVLKDISFEINKGERIVIVGENGSGKTTLSKIIAGVYQPKSGEMLYDGIPFEELEKESFYKHYSVVSQDFVKYRLSLRENIGISTPNQIENDQKLMNTIKHAEIQDIVAQVGGLDVQLGREFDGVELSGGQWQKVAIARGLNKDCAIFILDEPTAAIDPMTEYDILTKFIDITQVNTAVIISHRVGICKFADKIIVMKNGEIIEVGTHEQLLSNRNEYARLWYKQASWYNES